MGAYQQFGHAHLAYFAYAAMLRIVAVRDAASRAVISQLHPQHRCRWCYALNVQCHIDLYALGTSEAIYLASSESTKPYKDY